MPDVQPRDGGHARELRVRQTLRDEQGPDAQRDERVRAGAIPVRRSRSGARRLASPLGRFPARSIAFDLRSSSGFLSDVTRVGDTQVGQARVHPVALDHDLGVLDVAELRQACPARAASDSSGVCAIVSTTSSGCSGAS